MKARCKKQAVAEAEYKRLIAIYGANNENNTALQANDNLIKKAAELFAELEALKSVPSVLINRQYPEITKETAAGKMRIKLMAQYTNTMNKLNKDFCSQVNINESEDLEDFED